MNIINIIKKNPLIRKFLSFSIGNWVVLIIGLIATPLITRIISTDNYGKFSMFNLYINIFMIVITCGIDQSFVRFYYEEEEKNRTRLLFDCLKIPFILNLIITVGMLVFNKPISMKIINSHDFSFILALVINTTLMAIYRFSLLTVRMKQKGKLYSALQIVQKVTYLASIGVFFFIYKDNYMTLVYATLMSTLVVVVVSIFTERDVWRFKSVKGKTIKNSQKDIIKYGAPLALTFLVTWLFQSADRMAIKNYGTYADLGVYGAAFNIIAILNIIQTSFTSFWVPVAFEKYEKEPNNTKFFTDMNDLVSFSMFLVGIGLILCKDIIVILLGAEYREARYIMPFLVFMPVLYTMSEVSVMGINFKKRPKYHIIVALISCGVNIIGNTILVPKIGPKGAAISTGIAYMVFYFSRTIISTKLYKVDYNLKKTILMLIMVTIFALYSSFTPFNALTAIIGITEIGILIFVYKETIKGIVKKVR